ncbi:MAG: adenylate/guanylate cyclase domain-containing protein [Chloroflexota bacterium]
MRTDLPRGTVTFLVTDVEGSTRLLQKVGAVDYAQALADHRRIVREACRVHGGIEVDTQGDAFLVAFPSAPEAIRAAGELTTGLGEGPIQVRVGIHTGTPLVTDDGYVGEVVHVAARIASAAHGGQVLVSPATRDLLDDPEVLVDLGEHRLKDVADPVVVYQLGKRDFPTLRTISANNLPHPASSFVGRVRELAEAGVRLDAGARLLTLTGPGGSGKTRLAIELGRCQAPPGRSERHLLVGPGTLD